MHSITANIAVKNAREASDFYASVFGGSVVEFIETEQGCEFAHVNISPHTSIYLHDTEPIVSGSQIRLSIALHDINETHKLFSALSEGGVVIKDLHKPEWAELYGEVRDKYGVLWTLDSGFGEDMSL